MASAKMFGKVKWFNDKKGYGFIRTADMPEDIFVHHSSIRMAGYRSLLPGQNVEFEVLTDQRGVKAINVKVIAEVA